MEMQLKKEPNVILHTVAQPYFCVSTLFLRSSVVIPSLPVHLIVSVHIMSAHLLAIGAVQHGGRFADQTSVIRS